MQFLVIGKPQQTFLGSNPPTDLKEALEGELAKSREYYGAGHLRSIWLIAGHKGAAALFEAESIEAIQKLVDDFPMVKKGYVKHEFSLSSRMLASKNRTKENRAC